MQNCIPPEIAAQLAKQLKSGTLSTTEIAKMLPEEKAALRALAEGVVSRDLGLKPSAEDVKFISNQAKKIDAAQKAVGNDLGNPEKTKENVAFFKEKKVMDDYLASKHPASKASVLTGTIGRGTMLLAPKSVDLNVESNIIAGAGEFLSRRITSGLTTGRLRGADISLALDYWKMAWSIYQKTGYDVSRMMSLSDNGAGGSRILGDTVHAAGPGAVRALGRVYEDLVFKNLMGAPDAAFAAAHFGDSVNLNAMALAKGNKAVAREMMIDAMRVTPQTPIGELLKAQGVLDAQVATWTNDTWGSRVSEKFRGALNEINKDARLGDYFMPFVKTPANVISTGVDYSGGGLIKAAYDSARAIKAGEFTSKAHVQSAVRNVVRSGLGIAGAYAFTQLLNDDDFVGAWDSNRAQIAGLQNSHDNSIRLGGKWYSTDWLGPWAIPVTAMMYARKYGKTPGEKAIQYVYGVESGIENLPGLDLAAGAARSSYAKKGGTVKEVAGAGLNFIASELVSRLVPSGLGDLAKAFDDYERDHTQKWFQGLQAKIPGWENKLPAKENIFGEKTKGEPAASDIFAGSRIKTDREDAVTRELLLVSDATDKNINFTDWERSTSKSLVEFKKKVGNETFDNAKAEYGAQLKATIAKEIATPAYRKMSPEDKLKTINNLDSETMKKVFTKYHFTP